MPCPECGSKVIVIDSGLQKCTGCGSYLRPKSPLSTKTVIYSTKPTTTAITPIGLSEDQSIFVNRVAEKLAPAGGPNLEATVRALKVQGQFRKELADVFLEKTDFDEWFSQKKTQLGLHTFTFIKILYDCLEGLKSPEAQSLRQEYAQTLTQMGAGT